MSTLSAAGPLDVTGVLVEERRALLDLLGEFDAEDWRRRTECPAWTVKGLALHVLGDDLSLLSRQRDKATNGLLLYAEDHPGLDFRQLLDGFNEEWVRAAQFLSEALVCELLALTGDWTARYYSTVDPQAPGEPVGFFAAQGPSAYWQIAAREYVERWVHHHQLRRALGRPNLDGHFLGLAAAAVVRSLSAHLPDLGAGTGATIVLALPGMASWTLRRTDAGWSLFDGTHDAPAATLTLDPATATTVLSRGLPRSEAEGAFAVTGDVALGGSAVAAIARMASRDGGA